MRIFILDDQRHMDDALHLVGITPRLMSTVLAGEVEQVVLSRTIEHAIDTIEAKEVFDVWVLDHDLGGDDTGLKFLKLCIEFHEDKLPKELFCCSANPPGRANIESYWASYMHHKNFMKGS